MAGDRRRYLLTGHIESHRVAHRHTKRFGHAGLDRKGRPVGAMPASLVEHIAKRKISRIREVELPLRQASGPIIRIAFGCHRLPVDGHQTAADHRHQIGLGLPRVAEKREKILLLVRLKIDHEAIRRIGRHGVSPGRQQIGPHQREQQQRHQPKTHRRGLNHLTAHASPERQQPLAPPTPHRQRKARQQRESNTTQGGKTAERRQEAGRNPGTQHDIIGDPHNDRDQHRQTAGPRGACRANALPQLPAHDAQTGHPRQPDQMRQDEAEQQGESDHDAMHHREDGRCRQGHAQDLTKPVGQHRLETPAQQHPNDRRHQAEDHELQQKQLNQLCLPGAKTAQHGATIEMACHEAPGAQADGDGRQHHRQTGGEAQKTLRALQRHAHFGPGVVDGLDTLSARENGCRALTKLRHGSRLTRHMQSIGHARASLDQAGSRQVGRVDHNPRQHAEEVGAAV